MDNKDPTVVCSNCGAEYPDRGSPFRCLDCSGIFNYSNSFTYNLKSPADISLPGIWKWKDTFSFPTNSGIVSLGEGNTPLVPVSIRNKIFYIKCEYLNPTGSFKDRGSCLIISWVKSRGITDIIEDSSGNAGASIAAYASRGGVRAKIFIPESASGIKKDQIASYGAQMVRVPGPRDNSARAALSAASSSCAYASHAWLPYNLPGYATIAYELFEQLNGRVPGSIILPVGQGGLLLGISKGFTAIQKATKNYFDRLVTPVFIGVQVKTCAPYHGNTRRQSLNVSQTSLVEGVMVSEPTRKVEVLKSLRDSGGKIHLVSEPSILKGLESFAKLGFFIEPTSAIVWDAIISEGYNLPEPVIVILTGSGYKVH